MARFHLSPTGGLGQSRVGLHQSNAPAASLVEPSPGIFIVGTDGRDNLYAPNGDDTIDGRGGNDSLFGRDGNDSILGGAGVDWIYGGNGEDTVFGNAGQDVIFGNFGNDQLYGEARLDRLYGEDGNDTLWGGDDFDILNGGPGVDSLFGGAGADYFDFFNLDEVGLAPGTLDVIKDFEIGVDKIRLNGMDSDTIHNGNNVFRLSSTGLHDGLPGSLRVVTEGGNTYVMADRDGDSVSDFSIQIDGIHALSAADILL